MTPMVRVGDLAEQIRGVTFSKGDASTQPKAGFVPVLRAGNIQESGLSFDDLVYVPADRVSQRQFVRRDDVVIAASSGSLDVVGKAARSEADFEGGFGAFLKVLRPRGEIDHKYFAHYFKTREYRRTVSALAAGANINNLKNEHLDELLIPLPPLDEQRRIAAILDRADSLARKYRRLIYEFESLANSEFAKLLGRHPDTLLLGDVAEFFGGTTLPAGEPFKGQHGGYFLMKVSDMNAPGNEESVAACAQWSALPGPKAATCPIGSVVVPKRGGAISTNKKRITVRPTVLDPNLMGIAPKSDAVTSGFLFYWFKQFDLVSITSGSAVPQLNKRDLEPLSFPVVDESEQHSFERKLRGIETQASFARKALEHSERLFQSLQSRAFAGQL